MVQELKDYESLNVQTVLHSFEISNYLKGGAQFLLGHVVSAITESMWTDHVCELPLSLSPLLTALENSKY